MITTKVLRSILFLLVFFSVSTVYSQDKNMLVRLAKIELDSTYLEEYKLALKEEIETSLQLEPGVLTLYAVYDKDNPTQVTILETYANEEAYQLHLKTPHFIKYKEETMHMVNIVRLVDVMPIAPKKWAVK